MTIETDSEFVSASLLQLIRCPVTNSKLERASAELVTQLNEKLKDGELVDQLGRPIESPLACGLVNADQSLFFRVCGGIIRLVVGDAIRL